MELDRDNKVHVLNEWLFVEEEEEGKGILNNNIALTALASMQRLELQSYQNDMHALTPVIS